MSTHKNVLIHNRSKDIKMVWIVEEADLGLKNGGLDISISVL